MPVAAFVRTRAHTAPVPVGQSCRFAPISPSASAVMLAAGRSKTSLRWFLWQFGHRGSDALPGAVSGCALRTRAIASALDSRLARFYPAGDDYALLPSRNAGHLDRRKQAAALAPDRTARQPGAGPGAHRAARRFRENQA